MSASLEDLANYDIQYFADAYGYNVEKLSGMMHIFEVENSESLNYFKEVSDILHLTGSIFGALSNLFFIIVLFNATGTLKSALKLLLSLAVSDFCQSCLNMLTHFFHFDTIYRQHIEIEPTTVDRYIIQRILSDMYLLTELTGHVILVILAVDIFLAVRKPFLYHRLMSKGRINLVIWFMWALCFLLVVCTTIIVELLKTQTTEDGLNTWNVGFGYTRMYISIRQFQDVFFLAIVAMYVGIALQLRKMRFKKLSVAKRTKLALVLGTIILCYMFCNWPFVSTAIEMIGDEGIEVGPYVWRAIYISSAYRAFLNSVGYAARLPDVRREANRCCMSISVQRETKRCCMNISFNRKEKRRRRLGSVGSSLRPSVVSKTTKGTSFDDN